MSRFKDSIRELIAETSTNLPSDVRQAMRNAMAREAPGSRSALALAMIASNVDLAVDHHRPICQDTGVLTFELKVPVGTDELLMSEAIAEAIREATRDGKLRPIAWTP